MRNGSTIYGSTAKIQRLAVGAGGTVSGGEASSDGTMVIRTDTWGGYVRGPSASRWTPLIQMGVNLTEANGKYNYFPTNGSNVAAGAYDVAIAWTNSSHILIAAMGFIYRSTDQGATWAKTGLSLNAYMDSNGPTRVYRKRLIIDPGGTSVFAFGDPTPTTGGLQVSTNSGTTWAKNAQVPAGTTTASWCLASDRSSTIVSGSYQTVYAFSPGNGIYRSTTGWGGTFALIASSPTSGVTSMIAFGGSLFVTDGTGIKKWNGTTWTQPSSDTRMVCLAVNYADTTKVICFNDASQYSASSDSGATWTNASLQGNLGRTATDIPWLATTREDYMSHGMGWFDPANAGQIVITEGIGVWKMPSAPLTSTGSVTYQSISLGIDQMVSMQITVTPTGRVLYACQDRNFTCFDKDRVLVYPPYQGTHYGPPNSLSNTAIDHGTGIDYASDNESYIVGVSSANFLCSISTNGGRTWAAAPTVPPNVSTGTGVVAGSVAVNASGNIVWAPVGNGSAVWYTTNGGTAWTESLFAGQKITLSTDLVNVHPAYYLQRSVVVADKTVAGTFYVYIYGDSSGIHPAVDTAFAGLWKSTDGGANFTRQRSTRINASSVDFYHGKLKMVPGQTGHMIWIAGDVSGDDVAADIGAWFSSDGGVNWTRIPGIYEPEDMVFGAAAPGTSYPALYSYGYSSIGSNATRGLYACFNFNPANVAGATHVQISNSYFLGDWDSGTILGAHPSDTFGRLNAGKGGSGGFVIDFQDVAHIT